MSTSDCAHNAPLPFVLDTLTALAAGSRPLRLLDVGCGSGRHLCAAAALGFDVVGIDRNEEALALAQSHLPQATLLAFDVEEAASFPPALASEAFDVIVTTFFLFRPLIPAIAASLSANGHWVLETFHAQNRVVHGRPRREHFALKPGEAASLATDAGLTPTSVAEGDHRGTWTTQLVAQRQ